ncbi:YqfQ family protein [Peribacillus asahii]|uniref:YqfQ family protein n=1 Tax=Peribacillus asahii TaxID=228899 RepID=UPI0020798F37|nr:YqfQ family protein [Peribacillus asahii]USK84107.1 YqfQ family protein [Peribacillus asahii]
MIQGRHPGSGPNFPPSNRRNMYPPSNFQRGMPAPSGSNSFFQQMPQQPRMRQPRVNAPFHQQDMMQQRPKKEGLIGRLLGKSKQKAAPQNLFATPSQGKQETRSNNSGGGIMETLRNPEGITNLLNNTQKVLQAAEQFTPIVQQYGPMIKNLPSMWNIIRAFSSNDNDKKEEPKQEENISKETVTEIPTEESPKSTAEQTAQQKMEKKPKPKKKKTSGPKLYI